MRILNITPHSQNILKKILLNIPIQQTELKLLKNTLATANTYTPKAYFISHGPARTSNFTTKPSLIAIKQFN